MAEGFITRRGGISAGTKAPSINFVSETFDSITFTITNNDTATVDIFWELADSTPDQQTFELSGETTSGNITVDNLNELTTYTIFAFANSANKAGSETVSLSRTTPAEPITYTNATGGTTTTYEDNGTFYKSHTFTSGGNFVVSSVGNGNRNQVDYLIIAGGGGSGGGADGGAGGGGAGGYVEGNTSISANTFSITVGAGGAKSDLASTDGYPGNNSSFNNIVGLAGGGGNSNGAKLGQNGGSGGGAGGQGSENGGIGLQPSSSSGGFGNNGGNQPGSLSPIAGAGGGGSGSIGQNPSSGVGGNGGTGKTSSINGTSVCRAGGGGGGSQGGTGGSASCGGGNGGSSGVIGTNGAANSGGGAGGTGTGQGRGATGGSGVVIIRYEVEAV